MPAGEEASALRPPVDLGRAAAGGLAVDPPAGVPALAATRAECAPEAAEKAAVGQQRQQLRAAASGAQGPRLGVGLPARPDEGWPGLEVVHAGGRVHARVPGPGGESRDDGQGGERSAGEGGAGTDGATRWSNFTDARGMA